MEFAGDAFSQMLMIRVFERITYMFSQRGRPMSFAIWLSVIICAPMPSQRQPILN